jgi:hypothetical protein
MSGPEMIQDTCDKVLTIGQRMSASLGSAEELCDNQR